MSEYGSGSHTDRKRGELYLKGNGMNLWKPNKQTRQDIRRGEKKEKEWRERLKQQLEWEQQQRNQRRTNGENCALRN